MGTPVSRREAAAMESQASIPVTIPTIPSVPSNAVTIPKIPSISVTIPDSPGSPVITTEHERKRSSVSMSCSPSNQMMLDVLTMIEDSVGQAVETDDDFEYKKMLELAQ